MNPQERLDLKKLMQQPGHDYEDNTDGIRKLRHSDLIRDDILTLEELKKERKTENETYFKQICQTKCAFLFNSYTDVFNRVLNDEIDLAIMGKALHTLKQIEDGKINQQEGSVLMGKLFYQIFVDSALKKGEKLDQIAKDEEPLKEYRLETSPLTYKEYKLQKKN